MPDIQKIAHAALKSATVGSVLGAIAFLLRSPEELSVPGNDLRTFVLYVSGATVLVALSLIIWARVSQARRVDKRSRVLLAPEEKA